MMIPDLQLQTYQTKDILVGLLLLVVVVLDLLLLLVGLVLDFGATSTTSSSGTVQQ